MPEIGFEVRSVSVDSRAVTPHLRFPLRVRELGGGSVDTILLHCQIMIEARRRTYVDAEREALFDLFGEPSRWGTTLKTLLWTHVATSVPTFERETVVDLIVPCSYDLSTAAARYFVALQDGEVPLTFQFSGTVFHRNDEGSLQVAPVPWSAEAHFRLPVRVWRELMARQYPDVAWVPLRRDLFERLHRRRMSTHGHDWDAVVEELLENAAAPSDPAAAPGAPATAHHDSAAATHDLPATTGLSPLRDTAAVPS